MGARKPDSLQKLYKYFCLTKSKTLISVKTRDVDPHSFFADASVFLNADPDPAQTNF